MGARGVKSNPAVTDRNARIWYRYVSLLVLGYERKQALYEKVAKEFGVLTTLVVQVIHGPPPENVTSLGSANREVANNHHP